MIRKSQKIFIPWRIQTTNSLLMSHATYELRFTQRAVSLYREYSIIRHSIITTFLTSYTNFGNHSNINPLKNYSIIRLFEMRHFYVANATVGLSNILCINIKWVLPHVLEVTGCWLIMVEPQKVFNDKFMPIFSIIIKLKTAKNVEDHFFLLKVN